MSWNEVGYGASAGAPPDAAVEVWGVVGPAAVISVPLGNGVRVWEERGGSEREARYAL